MTPAAAPTKPPPRVWLALIRAYAKLLAPVLNKAEQRWESGMISFELAWMGKLAPVVAPAFAETMLSGAAELRGGRSSPRGVLDQGGASGAVAGCSGALAEPLGGVVLLTLPQTKFQIIGVTGRKREGKDTVGGILHRRRSAGG